MTKHKTGPRLAASPSPETFDLPALMPADLAAASFGVSVATMRRYHRQGLLNAARAKVGTRGGKLLFRRDDLLALFGLSTSEAT